MIVNVPRCRHTSVIIHDKIPQIIFSQHKLSHNPAALTLSGVIGQPLQFRMSILLLERRTVFQICPVRVGHIHPVVTDFLAIPYLIVIHTDFPIPLSSANSLGTFLVNIKSKP